MSGLLITPESLTDCVVRRPGGSNCPPLFFRSCASLPHCAVQLEAHPCCYSTRHSTLPHCTMFDTVCSYPLSSDLFAQVIHPAEPIVSVGLSSGHVETFRLPPTSNGGPGQSVNGFGHIDTVWRTRRHKGSCRCLGFGHQGHTLYSAGTDGWVKAAKTETGRVESKIAVPRIGNGYVLF